MVAVAGLGRPQVHVSAVHGQVVVDLVVAARG